MKKIFYLVLLLSVLVRATDRTVCPSGCGYTTFQAAASAAANYDTITFSNGPNTYVVRNVTTDVNKGVLIRSSTGTDTLKLKPIGGRYLMQAQGDSIKLLNMNFAFLDTVVANYNRLFGSSGYGGHTFKNCYFAAPHTVANTIMGYYSRANSGIVTEPSLIQKCIFVNLGTILGGADPTAATQATNVTIDSCVLDSCNIRCGKSWTISNCVLNRCNAENIVADSADSIHISNTYFGSQSMNGELLTWDESNNKKSKYNYVRNCVFDSVIHIGVCYDAQWYSSLYNNVFLPAINAQSIYNHNNNVTNGDTQSVQYKIYSNSFIGGNYNADFPEINCDAHSASDSGVYGLRISKNLFGNRRDIVGAKDANRSDTLDSCVISGSPTISSSRITDTLLGRPMKTLIVDTLHYPFLIQKASNPAIYNRTNHNYTGAYEYLTNLSTASSITSSSYAVSCSLSSNFRWSNQSNTFSNTWFTGDSATIILQDSSSVATWGTRATIGLRAGDKASFSRTGATASVKYKFRAIATGYGVAASVIDTTYPDSATTLAEASPTPTATPTPTPRLINASRSLLKIFGF